MLKWYCSLRYEICKYYKSGFDQLFSLGYSVRCLFTLKNNILFLCYCKTCMALFLLYILMNISATISVLSSWQQISELFLCVQTRLLLQPRLHWEPQTSRWVRTVCWRSVSTGPFRQSPTSLSTTSKSSGSGVSRENHWCLPGERGERPPTG